MAKHKAATEITIVQEERSAFQQWVDRYKWPALGLLAAVSAVILFRTNQAQSALESDRAAWGELHEARTGALPGERASSLMSAADRLEGPLASWALFEAAGNQAFGGKQDDVEAARAAFVRATSGDQVHPLLEKIEFPVGLDGAESTLSAAMEQRLSREATWLEQYGNEVYDNPPLPDGHPRVELVTDKGTILIGLYEDLAPEHVANFLKLVNEGSYDGTRFHRTMTGSMIQGGDPNSKDLDAKDTWGQGGPGYTIPAEESGLIHVEGALAAAKKGGASDSSGSQFYITAQPMHDQFDGRYVVYGVVIEGLDIVQEISNGETVEGEAEKPLEAVVLTSARVLE